MDRLANLLEKPGFFYCERARCRLKISICLKRQKANKTVPVFESMSFLICQKCEQGESNRVTIREATTMKNSGTDKDELEENTSKPKNTRRCECGNITISPTSPLCPFCMAAKANEKRRGRKKKSKSTRKGSSAPAKKDRQKMGGKISESIVVDFDGYENLFEWLKSETQDQVRTLPGQIIWLLKNSQVSNRNSQGLK